MGVLSNPAYMIAAFVALVLGALIYEIGSLMGARKASKPWDTATGISLDELVSGKFKEELVRLRTSVDNARAKK